MNQLFAYLANITFTDKLNANRIYFEELINLISLIIDCKFLELMLQSPDELKKLFEKLLAAIQRQKDYFDNLDQVDQLVSDLLESKKLLTAEERKYGRMPAPWDEYSVQVLKF